MRKNSRKLIYFLPFIPIIMGGTIILLIAIYIATPFTVLLGYSFVEGMKYNPFKAPKPQVTYGEFPVELTYTIDGETKTVTDTYICKYNDYDDVLDLRDWDIYLKKTKKVGFLLYKDFKVKIYCQIGHGNWYMGDCGEEPQPIIHIEYSGHSKLLSEEELYEKYRIQIVNWKTSPPITNSFEEFEKTGDG